MSDDPSPTEPTDRPSRRRFFALGASLATATLAGAQPAAAQQGTPPKKSAARDMVRRILNEPRPDGGSPFAKAPPVSQKGWDSTLVRLVRHVTNGVTEEELKLARKLGFNGYLNYHLAWSRIDDSAVQTFVAQSFPLIAQSGDQLYNLDQNAIRLQLTEAALYRAAFSRRQLYERMVEFWSDHFNISFPQVNYLKVADDRDVIRRHALGMFPDLLKASAHSPAMLEYLDNTRNRQRTLNENYAREIMELHTLGVDGGYTQGDVRELARILTGWTISGRGGAFTFDATGHDFGAKVVMGQSFPALPTTAGLAAKGEGDQMIDFLVRHPSTARFIATKMLRWLLQYEPTVAQVAAVAAVYSRTQGNIPAMVRAILTPANLQAAAPKFKRPYTFVLSALRALKPNVTRLSGISQRYLVTLGQPMFLWDAPDGYPDRAEYWAGGVLQRWNFATYLTTTTSEVVMDIGRFTSVNTPQGLTDAIGRELFGGEMPDALRARLTSYLQAQPVPTQQRAREAIALALSSSSFQWI